MSSVDDDDDDEAVVVVIDAEGWMSVVGWVEMMLKGTFVLS